MLCKIPNPPYYAVIFTTLQSDNTEGYLEMAKQMEDLVSLQKGFLGFDSARDKVGITVSYWKDLESINLWRNNMEHQAAKQTGKEQWYKDYTLRIAKVERQY
ncbi:MAG: antibiotic biosynthesis monooxygenase [Bacteroidetes bacterium]|nr:MAG: antibiotic biosynthesis monooxygenase [Bacteroidota bacterium]